MLVEVLGPDGRLRMRVWCMVWLLSTILSPCNTGNVALGGVARLSGTTTNPAHLAIDGDLSTVIDRCALAHAVSGNQGYWEVDLQESFIITDITIYNADRDPRRLEETAITIGSEATLASMSVCGNTGDHSDTIVNIQCDPPLVGRYVRLTRDAGSYQQRWIQLCEVQINGYYSPYDRTFTRTIQVSDATSSTMTLLISSWLPNTDEDLEVYFYRVEYKQPGGDWIVAGDAPHTAAGFIIFTIEPLEANVFYEFRALPGVVLEGIEYIGPMGLPSSLFRTPCMDGSWGINCDPCNCADEEEMCDVIEGSCLMSGCAAGYQGTGCDEECQNGMWGTNCAEMCNCEDVDEACDNSDGSCMISGCAAGYQGAGCQQGCAEGTWGGGCTEICNCLDENEVCLTTDGSCPMSGCPAGYQGTACNQECSEGTWGINCVGLCTCGLDELCDVRNGSCMITPERDSNIPKIVGSVAVLVGIVAISATFIICLLKRRARKSELAAAEKTKATPVIHPSSPDNDTGPYEYIDERVPGGQNVRREDGAALDLSGYEIPEQTRSQATAQNDYQNAWPKGFYENVPDSKISRPKTEIPAEPTPSYLSLQDQTRLHSHEATMDGTVYETVH